MAFLVTFLTVVQHTRDVVVLGSRRYSCVRVCTQVDASFSRDRRLEIGVYLNSIQTLTYQRQGVPLWTGDWGNMRATPASSPQRQNGLSGAAQPLLEVVAWRHCSEAIHTLLQTVWLPDDTPDPCRFRQGPE